MRVAVLELARDAVRYVRILDGDPVHFELLVVEHDYHRMMVGMERLVAAKSTSLFISFDTRGYASHVRMHARSTIARYVTASLA
ncbi:MAG: hypothetical protein U1E65_14990 [Myxococcota bacterium]